MAAVPAPHHPLILGWPRLRVMLTVALAFAVVHLGDSPTPFQVWFARNLTVAMFATIAYGTFERWPAALPTWLERWVLQVIGVIVGGAGGAIFAYGLPVAGNLSWVIHDASGPTSSGRPPTRGSPCCRRRCSHISSSIRSRTGPHPLVDALGRR